jgi:hypothetical protein
MLRMIVVFDSRAHTHTTYCGAAVGAPRSHLYGLSTAAVIHEKLGVKDPDTTQLIISRQLARGKLFGSSSRDWRPESESANSLTQSSFPVKTFPSPVRECSQAASTLGMTVMSFEQAEISPCNLCLAPLLFNVEKHVVNSASQKNVLDNNILESFFTRKFSLFVE